MTPIIWTYWHQGFQEAPTTVKYCVRRLKELHPDYTIHLLDAGNVYDFAEKVPIDNNKWKQLCLPHQSDLLRTQLLIKYGGVWLDPTIYCQIPLDDWLPEKMGSGLFLFDRPGRDRIISNWFIAAEQGNYFLTTLYNSLIGYWNHNDFSNLGREKASIFEYWCNRVINGRSLEISQLWLTPLFTKVIRLYPYMIYHYMFYKLVKIDARCDAIYQEMPKISADGPHRLQRLGLLSRLTTEGRSLIDQKEIPLFKLNWKITKEEPPLGSHLHYLFNQPS